MEEWKPVRGFEEYYIVSNMGIIRSLDRFVRGKDASARKIKGQELTPRVRADGSFAVNLWRDNVYHQIPVARIVLEAFDRPRPLGHDARPTNRNPADNRLSNLRWRLDGRLRRAESIKRRTGQL
jgi:hypothetical protein